MLEEETKAEQVLKTLEETAEQFWNISRDSALLLYALAKALQSKNILEIGTSNGYSGIWFALALKALAEQEKLFDPGNREEEMSLDKPGRRLFTIESHQVRFDLAKQNFEKAGVASYITQIKGHAPEVFLNGAEIKEGQLDLVFLDATKAEHCAYLEAIMPLLKKGGLLIADNILSHQEELQSYVEKVNSLEALKSMVLPVGAGLMISQKVI